MIAAGYGGLRRLDSLAEDVELAVSVLAVAHAAAVQEHVHAAARAGLHTPRVTPNRAARRRQWLERPG